MAQKRVARMEKVGSLSWLQELGTSRVELSCLQILDSHCVKSGRLTPGSSRSTRMIREQEVDSA